MNVAICEDCADYIDAGSRFEQLTVGPSPQQCAGCHRKGIFYRYRVEGHLGHEDCSDCMTMTHCESHHKIEGLYPWGTPRHGEEKP